MEILMPEDMPEGAILVIHSWWGLTSSFREYGKSLAAAGYIVGLTDLFDGKIAQTETEAQKLRAQPRLIPMYKTLGADIDSLRRRAGRQQLDVGVVGFSMGGHWAVWLAQRPEHGIATTVLYYAARGGDFRHCRSDILVHFAENDVWVRASARKNMEKAICKAGCSYQAYDYPGTQHWFAEQDRKKEFDRQAASLALERDLSCFQSRLNP